VKFYLDAGKIAAATDKICSSLDKTARDNRQNSANFAKRVKFAFTLLSHTRRIHRPRKRRRRFEFWYQKRTHTLLLILAARRVGMDYARVNLKFR